MAYDLEEQEKLDALKDCLETLRQPGCRRAGDS